MRDSHAKCVSLGGSEGVNSHFHVYSHFHAFLNVLKSLISHVLV